MTKQELLDAVEADAGAGVPSKTVAAVVDSIFKNIATGVEKDGKFFMPGFGTFSLKERQARVGRNPRTGDKIDIPASRTIGFKVAAGLKKAL